MIIDDTNAIVNYNQHHTRDICKAVRELTPEGRQALLDEIQVRKGTYILTAQSFNQQTSEYIESLLNGKKPRNGLK